MQCWAVRLSRCPTPDPTPAPHPYPIHLLRVTPTPSLPHRSVPLKANVSPFLPALERASDPLPPPPMLECASSLPSQMTSLTSKVASTCSPRSGGLLGLLGRHSSRAAAPASALRCQRRR